MAETKIPLEEVKPAIYEFMKNEEKKSRAELESFLETTFGANKNQSSGIIFRLTEQKTISKVKKERGYYVIYGNSSIIESLSDDLEKLIKEFRKTLIAESVNPKVTNEDIIKLREILPKLDGVHHEMMDYLKN